MNILVVEDQKEIANVIQKYLQLEGYQVFLASNGLEALECFAKESIQLFILDIMMPGIDGFTVLSEVRKSSDVPIIIVSAKVSEQDRLRGFDLGVDDYVIKPFSPKELIRRVKAILKRTYQKTNLYQYKELRLNVDTMQLFKNDVDLHLTTAEFEIMLTFFKHQNQVLSREQLIEYTFGHDFEGYDRSMDTHIKRLRQKIETDTKNPTYLKTKYGAGYLFGG